MRATVADHWAEVRSVDGIFAPARFWIRQYASLAGLAVRLRRRDALVAAPDQRSSFARSGMFGLELREAARSLRRRPHANAGMALLLAFCSGAVLIVFSLAHGILRRPLPYPASDEVVLIGPHWLDGRASSGNLSAAEYVEVARRSNVFAGVGAIDHVERTLLDRGPPVELPGALVSASAFDVLGVPAALGRTFDVTEDVPGGGPVVVLSDALWRGAFGGAASVIGRSVRLGDQRYEVVGVMPRGFILPTEVGAAATSMFYLPLAVDPLDPGPIFVKDLNAAIARLKPAVTVDGATVELERIAAGIVARYAENYDRDVWTLHAISPVEAAVASARPTLGLLVLAVAFLVCAVCANLAGFLAMRGEQRRTEVGVRTALGARPMHEVRRMVVEGALLAVVGAGLGLASAFYALPAVRVARAGTLPRIANVELVPDVALLSIAAVTGTAVIFSLLPALRAAIAGHAFGSKGASRGIMGALGSGTRVSRSPLRALLIGGQIAIASMLLCGSVLLLRSLDGLITTDPGFVAADVRTVELSLPSAQYAQSANVEAFYARLLTAVETAPGIDNAGLVRRRPMADRYGTWTVALRGHDESRRLDDAPPRWQVATPGYFRTLAIGLEEGRMFTEAELGGRARVALVNRAFADRHWPGRSALGTEIRMDGGPNNPWLTVVGVLADVRTDGARVAPEPLLYLPFQHFAEATSTGPQRSMSLVMRTSLDDEDTRRLVELSLAALDPELPHGAVRAMDDIVAASYAETRLLSSVLSVFALITVLLGATGIYVSLAYDVVSTSRELGIRCALGADPGRLVERVLRKGVTIAGVGIATGVTTAFLLAGSIATHLFGVEPRDPLTFVVAPLLLFVTAAVASYAPARRAARADPVVALRSE